MRSVTFGWALLLLLSGSTARAEPVASLEQAQQLFQAGQVSRAAELLRKQLSGLTRDADRRDATLLLGACAFVRGDNQEAERQFVRALAYDADLQPDPLLFAPDIRAAVRRVARERKDLIARERARREAEEWPAKHRRREEAAQPASRSASQTPAPTSASSAPSASQPGLELKPPTPLYLAVLPFGVAQFANGQRTKAWILLTAEVALLATSAACVVAAWQLRDEEGRYPRGDIEAARSLNVAYLATAYSALALVVYGAIDGLLHRRRDRPSPSRTWLLPLTAGNQATGLSLGGRF